MENFRRLFRNFFGIFGKFLQFFGKFLQFFGKFLQFFWKFSTIFCDFSENFSENSHSQSVTVQPESRHYCKFTSKFTSRFTPKFTPILIKILQSTKFEAPLFQLLSTPFNSFQLLTDFPNLVSTSQTFSPLCAPFPSPPRFLNHSSAMQKAPTAVPPLATTEVCGQYEGL